MPRCTVVSGCSTGPAAPADLEPPVFSVPANITRLNHHIRPFLLEKLIHVTWSKLSTLPQSHQVGRQPPSAPTCWSPTSDSRRWGKAPSLIITIPISILPSKFGKLPAVCVNCYVPALPSHQLLLTVSLSSPRFSCSCPSFLANSFFTCCSDCRALVTSMFSFVCKTNTPL